MEKILRVGIAGFGMSGQIFQAPFLNADPHYEIRKVYERTTNRAQAEYPSVETVRSFDELLTDDIDLVVISTPNTLHVPMTRQALLAGKHVVTEKPVAATAAEVEALCALAEQQGVVFSVYQNRRLDSDFLTVKKMIDDGRLGEIVDYEAHYDRFVRGTTAKRWKAAEGAGADNLYDLGVHIIDQAYSLFGLPREVYADFRTQRAQSHGVDNFEVILYYDGLRAILSSSEIAAQPGPHYMVHGREGSFLKYGMDRQEDDLIAGQRPPQPAWDIELPECYGTLSHDDGERIIEEKIPTVVSSYGKYYENLYRAITAGERLLVPPHQAADVLRILEAARRSSEEKRRIAL